jgi:hypothetical protein
VPEIVRKLHLRGRWLQGQKLPGEYKWIIRLQRSSGTSTNALYGRGLVMILTLPMLLLLLLLRPKTLDISYLITIE